MCNEPFGSPTLEGKPSHGGSYTGQGGRKTMWGDYDDDYDYEGCDTYHLPPTTILRA
jgi:hypothetical protein